MILKAWFADTTVLSVRAWHQKLVPPSHAFARQRNANTCMKQPPIYAIECPMMLMGVICPPGSPQTQILVTGCPPTAMQNCKASSCNTEELQMLLVIVMAVIAFAWSTFDSILNENAFQLLLSAPTMLIAGLGLTCTTVGGSPSTAQPHGALHDKVAAACDLSVDCLPACMTVEASSGHRVPCQAARTCRNHVVLCHTRSPLASTEHHSQHPILL
jgi:hypothetical protein